VQEPLARAPVAWEGGDAGADGQHLARFDQSSLRGTTAHPVNHLGGLADIGSGEREHELVAADATAEVTGPQLGTQRVRQRTQRVVADGVAMRVVDSLEVVNVERDHRDGISRASGPLELLVEALLEGTMVEQAGQRIVGRLQHGVGHAIEVARQVADLVAAPPAQACAAVALADPVGRLPDALYRANHGAAEQQHGEQAENQGGGESEAGEAAGAGGARLVEAAEVVVELENCGAAVERSVNLGVVRAVGGVHFAIFLAPPGVVGKP
jgi:hypothetical protein